MFDWSHILHRQIYDVLADERLDQAAKDREVARLVAYYKTRRDLAFSSRPKSMKLMQEQPYSLAFRTKYPKFNGLIWAYHWMQVGLYEPLVVGRNAAERQAGVRATVARFWQMLGDPPKTLPYQMPMTAAVAPEFARRYPEAAIIFDNLHSMHDVVSDILANPSVPKSRKGAEIALAARRFRDDTTLVMSIDAWRTMAQHMGIENMGGPSVGFLPALPTPTVTYGAVMQHDDRTGAMTGFASGQATGGAHAGHDMAAMPDMARDTSHADASHEGMSHEGMSHETMHHGATDSTHAKLMELHERMLADPVIRSRVRADTSMRRLLDAMDAAMPAEHRAMMEPAPRVTKDAPAKASTARKPAATKPAAKKADPHAGHTMPMPDMPGMTPAKKP
jgi:hypothetical protein